MKIAIVVYAFNMGGMESVLLELALSLKRKGHSVSFLVTEYQGAWHKHPLEKGFELISLVPNYFETPLGHSKRIAKEINKFDVCFLNHSKYAHASLGLLKPSVILISVLHNNNEEIFRVGLSNFNHLDAVIALGSVIAENAKKLTNKADRIFFLRNGITMPPEKDRSVHAGKLMLIFIGRINHEQKGVFYLPKITSALISKKIDFKLDIFGDGCDYESLNEIFKNKYFGDKVSMHGAIGKKEVLDVLMKADVLLMPSHYEGQPIALIEAMACGVVPVVSDIPGLKDVVADAGFMATVGDEESFAEVIKKINDNRNELFNKAQKSSQRMRECFSSEVMSKGYIEVVEKISHKLKNKYRSGKIDKEILGTYYFVPYLVKKVIKRIINV